MGALGPAKALWDFLKHWRLQPGEHHKTRDFPLHSISLLLELFKLYPSNLNPQVSPLVQEIPNPVAVLFPLLLSLLHSPWPTSLTSHKNNPLSALQSHGLFEQEGLHGSQDWPTQGDRVRDWPGSRKGTGTRTGSFQNLVRNFFSLNLYLLILLGLLYL